MCCIICAPDICAPDLISVFPIVSVTCFLVRLENRGCGVHLPSLSVWAGALHGWVWPSLAGVVYVLLVHVIVCVVQLAGIWVLTAVLAVSHFSVPVSWRALWVGAFPVVWL